MSEFEERLSQIVKNAIASEWDNGLGELIKERIINSVGFDARNMKYALDSWQAEKIIKKAVDEILGERLQKIVSEHFLAFYDAIALDQEAKRIKKVMRGRKIPLPENIPAEIRHYFVKEAGSEKA